MTQRNEFVVFDEVIVVVYDSIGIEILLIFVVICCYLLILPKKLTLNLTIVFLRLLFNLMCGARNARGPVLTTPVTKIHFLSLEFDIPNLFL
jgi:hypothetical protein